MNALPSNKYLKSTLKLAVLTLLLLLAASPCFAMRDIGIVSKQAAKEMGIEIRATPAGPDALWLELEFKPVGKLKSFSHVELEIREGEKSLISYAALSEKRSESGSVVVRFMAARAFLEKITLTVVTGFPSAYSGDEIRLKEFVDLEKLR
jgi:hypothetical protein